MTRGSPDGITTNQIDHLLIDARHASDPMNAKYFKGENIDSDHYLTISRIRSRISSERKNYGCHAKKFNKERLKEPEVIQAYVEGINESLSRLADNKNVCVTSKDLQEIIITTADER